MFGHETCHLLVGMYHKLDLDEQEEEEEEKEKEKEDPNAQAYKHIY